jgi:hypothetical protein
VSGWVERMVKGNLIAVLSSSTLHTTVLLIVIKDSTAGESDTAKPHILCMRPSLCTLTRQVSCRACTCASVCVREDVSASSSLPADCHEQRKARSTTNSFVRAVSPRRLGPWVAHQIERCSGDSVAEVEEPTTDVGPVVPQLITDLVRGEAGLKELASGGWGVQHGGVMVVGVFEV